MIKRISLKEKKGFLLAEETLKIIISVIVLVLLFALLGKLYYNHIRDKELEQATATLDRLILEINNGATEFQVYNPVDPKFDFNYWALMSWPHPSHGGPLVCGGKPCLCVAVNVWSLFSGFPFVPNAIDRNRDNCDNLKKGICRIVSKDIIVKGNINFQSPIGFKASPPPLNLRINYGVQTEILIA